MYACYYSLLDLHRDWSRAPEPLEIQVADAPVRSEIQSTLACSARCLLLFLLCGFGGLRVCIRFHCRLIGGRFF